MTWVTLTTGKEKWRWTTKLDHVKKVNTAWHKGLVSPGTHATVSALRKDNRFVKCVTNVILSQLWAIIRPWVIPSPVEGRESQRFKVLCTNGEVSQL